jgi:hypothetical protein
MIYRGDGSIHRLHEADELSGEDIIPGFRCPVREILPRHEPSPTIPTDPNGTSVTDQPERVYEKASSQAGSRRRSIKWIIPK